MHQNKRKQDSWLVSFQRRENYSRNHADGTFSSNIVQVNLQEEQKERESA